MPTTTEPPLVSHNLPLPGARTQDPWSDALECLDVHAWNPGLFELTAPWGIRMTPGVGWLYVVLQNGCRLEVEGRDDQIVATAGDLILVMEGHAHGLRDRADSPLTPIQTLLKPHHFEQRDTLVYGGGGVATRMFCGCLRVEGLRGNLLQTLLPAVLHVPASQHEVLQYADHVLSLLNLECKSEAPGKHLVLDQLVRVLFMKLVRSYLSDLPQDRTAWLIAVGDPFIGRVIKLMHAHPEYRWTVGLLAREAAMARSTFSARFTALTGKPPLEFLTNWRMQRASCLLRRGQFELKEIAGRVGYETTAAFSKAFSRWSGTAPGAYRRACRTEAASVLSQVAST